MLYTRVLSVCFMLFLSFQSQADQSLSCAISLFQSSLPPFSGKRVEPKSNEILKGGEQALSKVSLAARDGVYPVIITAQGKVYYIHRLPDPQSTTDQPYLGTHRSLYELAKENHNGQEVDIIFAGHIRIVGGKPVKLIDQANTFNDQVGDRPDIATREELEESNQKRLEEAQRLLIYYGLITAQTELTNFLIKSGHNPDFVDGHAADNEAVLLEMQFTQNPELAVIYAGVQKFITSVHQQEDPDRALPQSMQARVENLVELIIKRPYFFNTMGQLISAGFFEALIQGRDSAGADPVELARAIFDFIKEHYPNGDFEA